MKYVYSFEEGDGKNKQLLGGKGAGLSEMTQIGLPVPPGFTITVDACHHYYANQKKLPKDLMIEVTKHIKNLEIKTKKGFNRTNNPLLVSVRSGAAISMPGMMDTILNLGLNDISVEWIGKATKNRRFAYDTYRRFIQLFGKIALGVDENHFDRIFEDIKKQQEVKFDTDLTAESLEKICVEFKKIIKKEFGSEFPQDPWKQLKMAIKAVFSSWMSRRAIDYRREFKITDEMANGTAVNIVTMVFGNMSNDSATGVNFTRDPGTGENVLYGEYLINAQGEDVVAGIRTPKPIHQLKTEMPKQYEELEQVRSILEQHYREVQDFEFTIEQGTFYILQTRNGKMNAAAMIKTSYDMALEKLISKKEALLRINPEYLEQLLHPQIDALADIKPIVKGIAASPGAASGKIVFDADEAERLGRIGEPIILMREETKPEDIHGFFAANGILTSRGGKTSHAAVVARAMGKPCVVGCIDVNINHQHKTATIKGKNIEAGEIITIDGSNGSVYLGEVPTIDPEFRSEFESILKWADEIRTLEVRANAETPEDVDRAKKFGAQGIGLCRTERMFNATGRLPIVREMILVDESEKRAELLKKLMPMQKEDFKKIFKRMKGLPVTIRLLDLPLHEFLPSIEILVWEIERLKEVQHSIRKTEAIPDSVKLFLKSPLKEHLFKIQKIMSTLSKIRKEHILDDIINEKEEILQKVRNATEVNPMLGNRGVRLAIKYPEIYKMQIQAILESSIELIKAGINVMPEIMIPQVVTPQEIQIVQKWLVGIKRKIEKEHNIQIPLKLGTMIETVRSCMRAGDLAKITDFFSFGSNDLTQVAFSFSREDAENKFLPIYNKMKILTDNPFEVLDVKGVVELMKITIAFGKKTNPNLKLGLCGEHGGNPQSIGICHALGLGYVSCSPYRIPIARLAAAQAKLKEKELNSLVYS